MCVASRLLQGVMQTNHDAKGKNIPEQKPRCGRQIKKSQKINLCVNQID